MSRFAAVFLAFLMVFSVGNLYALADEAGNGDTSTSSDGDGTNSTAGSTAADAEVPTQPDDLYVYDGAGVISAETKSAINTKNADLNAKYGVQIVVFTMTTLPGDKSDYDGRAAYLKKVMDTWNVGGDSKSGLIVGLSVSDGDYMTVAGDGLHGAFASTTLNTLQHENLETDFQAGTYDAGVLKYFNALSAAAETYKSGNPTDPTAVSTSGESSAATSGAESGAESSAAEGSASSEAQSGGVGSVIFGILRFILILVILFAAFLLVVYLHGQHVRKKRREARRRRAEQRRCAARQETADPYTAPRRETPKRDPEDEYLDFINRYK